MSFELVSLTMVQNEADIIEYFCRSNLQYLDHMIIVVNPSSDGTGEILDALAAEDLPLTIWRTDRNHYAQTEMISWFTYRVRDQIKPDYLFVIDADEIILTKDRATLEAALESLPSNSVGTMPWRSFLPKSGARDDVFSPCGFAQRLDREIEPFVKTVIPASTDIHVTGAMGTGMHSVFGPDGRRIAPAPLPSVELAHIPVRSFAQIREKTIASIIARVIVSGAAWRERGESHQRETVWRMLQDKEVPNTSDLAAGYLNKSGGPLPKIVPDSRLPDVPLKLSPPVGRDNGDALYLQLSRRLYHSAFPLPDPTDLLDPAPEVPSETEAQNRDGLPSGAFAAAQHARVLKCDWPPLEQAANRFRPAQVLDLGCGLAAYLRLFAERGMDVVGVDGAPWSTFHQIPESAYRQHDLSAGPPVMEEDFDMSLCLEVVEHLPEAAGLALVRCMTGHTRQAIIFSAAQPGQPGDGHITCHPPEFWLRAFEKEGWSADPAASAALRLTSTLHWFRRNLFVLRPGPQKDPEGLAHLNDIAGKAHRWPDHGPGRILIGFAGSRPSFTLDGSTRVPPAPAYAPSVAPSVPPAKPSLWRRGVRRLRREMSQFGKG